jgi:hypothetical protein
MKDCSSDVLSNVIEYLSCTAYIKASNDSLSELQSTSYRSKTNLKSFETIIKNLSYILQININLQRL